MDCVGWCGGNVLILLIDGIGVWFVVFYDVFGGSVLCLVIEYDFIFIFVDGSCVLFVLSYCVNIVSNDVEYVVGGDGV